MEPAKSIPREIFFEIFSQLNLRDTIRAISIVQVDVEFADYICSHAHKIEFGSVLTEINAIEYEVTISEEDPRVISYNNTTKTSIIACSRRVHRDINVTYELGRNMILIKLKILSNKPWPLNLKAYHYSTDKLQNFKSYTQKWEESRYSLRRLIVTDGRRTDQRLKISIIEHTYRLPLYLM
jgi:hypothetical protein